DFEASWGATKLPWRPSGWEWARLTYRGLLHGIQRLIRLVTPLPCLVLHLSGGGFRQRGGRDQVTVARRRRRWGCSRQAAGMPPRHRGRAVLKGEADLRGVQLGKRVGRLNLVQGLQKLPAEIPHPRKALAKLVVQGGPGDILRPSRRHAVQP